MAQIHYFGILYIPCNVAFLIFWKLKDFYFIRPKILCSKSPKKFLRGDETSGLQDSLLALLLLITANHEFCLANTAAAFTKNETASLLCSPTHTINWSGLKHNQAAAAPLENSLQVWKWIACKLLLLHLLGLHTHPFISY